MSKGKILAIDYGDRRVGIAISDFDKTVAFPRGCLIVENLTVLVAAIVDLCASESVHRVVIGLPIEMDGTVGGQVKKTMIFGDRLRQSLNNVSVDYLDERLTSKQAVRHLQEQGVKAKDQKGIKDAISAQVILQAYLHGVV
jgi:putative holliday junction resolvase